MNYFSISAWPGDLGVNVAVNKTTVQAASRMQTPLCRIFDFTGHHISLENIHFDITDCDHYYQTLYEYSREDGVVISFSGESVEGVTLDGVELTSSTTSDMYTVGVRIGTGTGTVNVTGLTITGMRSTNINVTFSVWRGIGGWTVTDLQRCNTPCVGIYDANELEEVPNSDGWVLVNATGSMPPGQTGTPPPPPPSKSVRAAVKVYWTAGWGTAAFMLAFLLVAAFRALWRYGDKKRAETIYMTDLLSSEQKKHK